MVALSNSFSTKKNLKVKNSNLKIFHLPSLEKQGYNISKLPYSIRILLENLLRYEDGRVVAASDIEGLLKWDGKHLPEKEIAFMPARVLLQDFTGVPAVVDLAAMRSAVQRMKGDTDKINPLIPSELVIDHSVQVDKFGTEDSFLFNAELEFKRNVERYMLLRWGQKAFRDLKVVPPDTGICHQVNLEYLARVVETRNQKGEMTAFPDSLVGTDSHTTMINGLGVFGWGVGGIEAEAVMLGQPYFMMTPEVIGVRLTGELPEGSTATDLVLTITQILRKKGVVGKIVEYIGEGIGKLSLPDRATIGNMAPEYGATMGFFPVDDETVKYLKLTGRSDDQAAIVEAYCKEQGLFWSEDKPEPVYSDIVEIDMNKIETSVAGPKRPQDRVVLKDIKESFKKSLTASPAERGFGLKLEEIAKNVKVQSTGSFGKNGSSFEMHNGSVVIAAITSCTNTSNPSVLIAAGLLAKKAVEKYGLKSKPWVKTSLAPGSQVVMDYLKEAGVVEPLEELKFNLVGFGCTTCIGNSGPLDENISSAIEKENLVTAAVLSGNRNFEGRINPHAKASYLASPPLVVAYALAGRMDFDPLTEPVDYTKSGDPVYLKDIWPSQSEIRDSIKKSLKPEMYRSRYSHVFDGDERWRGLKIPEGSSYHWDQTSTYIQEPPFFKDLSLEPTPAGDITGARVLALLGDSVTTDHISPAGSIPVNSPAGKYLVEHGVQPKDFNSYGARRGNHEVMMRGTFANIRLKNLLVPGTEGGLSIHLPDGEKMWLYDASMKYQSENVPLLVIAGKEYGSGSSRDWAAKGTLLLGIKAVIAESYERIHRSNLVGLGVLPLQFKEGENAASLGLTGREVYTISGIKENLSPHKKLTISAVSDNGKTTKFEAVARLDSYVDVEYYMNGGILPTVLRQMLKGDHKA
ncbi:MAG: aconitate hydratase AcnA [Bacteroidetes bacterium]|nr:aconitate hydratase AcnA [Bacteroidota bacterium]MCL5738561.1 aconitate hydratase AcnA [Bacteroidota bacterium]